VPPFPWKKVSFTPARWAMAPMRSWDTYCSQQAASRPASYRSRVSEWMDEEESLNYTVLYRLMEQQTTYLPTHLPTYLPTHLPTYLPTNLPIYLPLRSPNSPP